MTELNVPDAPSKPPRKKSAVNSEPARPKPRKAPALIGPAGSDWLALAFVLVIIVLAALLHIWRG